MLRRVGLCCCRDCQFFLFGCLLKYDDLIIWVLTRAGLIVLVDIVYAALFVAIVVVVFAVRLIEY